jgi:hypothetical protein
VGEGVKKKEYCMRLEQKRMRVSNRKKLEGVKQKDETQCHSNSAGELGTGLGVDLLTLAFRIV